MGLSSKQVSSDGHGWSQSLLQANTLELPKPASMKRPQHQQQQTEQLNCPRCDSTNTKFCYYNNYNKSQPRHFCKTCKRHWTKGGTLRNVPVGGARKNKRIKTSAAAAAAATSTHVALQSHQQRVQNLPDQKNLSHVLYQPMIHPRNQSLIIPYASTSTSFNTTPSSISSSFQLSNTVIDNYAAGEEATNIFSGTTSMPITSSSTSVTQPRYIDSTNSGMDNLPSYWNWDIDIDTFVSTDLNIPWDDFDIKP